MLPARDHGPSRAPRSPAGPPQTTLPATARTGQTGPHAVRTIVVFPSGPRAPMLWPMPARHPLVVARLVAALAATLLLGSIAAAPALAADPRTGGAPRPPSVWPVVDRVRTVDVSRAGAAVHPVHQLRCVPAATQTMLNLVRGPSDLQLQRPPRPPDRELRAANKYRYPTLGNDVRAGPGS